MNIKSAIVRKLRDFALRGLRYECPICRRRYTFFLPMDGVFPSDNGVCPGCYSLPRQRALWLLLEHMANLGRVTLSGRMLHVAPEPCLSKRFKKMFNYVSIDLDGSKAMRRGNITDLREYDADTFDAIVCNHVLEHVPEDRKAMSELYRVLKPGGWASLQVPLRHDRVTDEDPTVTDPAERQKRWGQDDHVRLYGWDYTSRLSETGFEPLTMRWEAFVAPEHAALFVCNTLDIMTLAWKPAGLTIADANRRAAA